jgi:hypothetical protein
VNDQPKKVTAPKRSHYVFALQRRWAVSPLVVYSAADFFPNDLAGDLTVISEGTC